MPTPEMSDVITHGIRVGATAYYLPDESDPNTNVYFFGYRIVIVNQSSHTVQLLNRHWDIIDANGNCRTIDGPGVVGQQPRLLPQQGFKYTSFTKIPTPWATMDGHYIMRTDNHHHHTHPHTHSHTPPHADRHPSFNVTIGRFWLTIETHPHAPQPDTP